MNIKGKTTLAVSLICLCTVLTGSVLFADEDFFSDISVAGNGNDDTKEIDVMGDLRQFAGWIFCGSTSSDTECKGMGNPMVDAGASLQTN